MNEGGSRRTAASRGLARRVTSVAVAALLVGCTTAQSASPGPVATTTPGATMTPAPSSPIPTSTAAALASPPAPPPSQPPASPDPKYLGSFGLFPASPRAGFDMDIACEGSIGSADPVAIVHLKGAAFDDLVLRDYVNVDKPRTVCTFRGGEGNIIQLIDPQHIVLEDVGEENDGSDLFAVVTLPDIRYQWFELPATRGGDSRLITVGPQLDRIVWKVEHPRGTDTDILYLSTAGKKGEVATLRDTNGGRCGQATDSVQGRYAISDPYVYVLNQPILGDESLLVIKGREILFSIFPPRGGWATGQMPIFAVWSPVTPALYWSQGGDVWRWTPDSGRQKFLAGVAWYDPSISADGHYLAYSVVVSAGTEHVYLVDLTTGLVPHRIGDGTRSEPRFVNSTQLFYTGGEGFGSCGGTRENKLIYNVGTGSEDASIFDSVQATWPATSAMYW